MVPALIPGIEVEPHVLHQLLHGLAPVVPCDVRMEVLPDPLDAIVIRAVGRQEVEPQSPPFLRR